MLLLIILLLFLLLFLLPKLFTDLYDHSAQSQQRQSVGNYHQTVKKVCNSPQGPRYEDGRGGIFQKGKLNPAFHPFQQEER